MLLGLGPHIGAASPYFPCLGAMVQARCWKMHHGTTEQLLAVYPGTPIVDVLPAVRELFGFSETAPLRFRTEDGIPVALSSHLPDGVSLRVAVESGSLQQPAGTAATSTPASAGGPAPSDYAGGVSPRCGVNDRLMPKLCRDCQQLQSCRQRDMQTGDVGELSPWSELASQGCVQPLLWPCASVRRTLSIRILLSAAGSPAPALVAQGLINTPQPAAGYTEPLSSASAPRDAVPVVVQQRMPRVPVNAGTLHAVRPLPVQPLPQGGAAAMQQHVAAQRQAPLPAQPTMRPAPSPFPSNMPPLAATAPPAAPAAAAPQQIAPAQRQTLAQGAHTPAAGLRATAQLRQHY